MCVCICVCCTYMLLWVWPCACACGGQVLTLGSSSLAPPSFYFILRQTSSLSLELTSLPNLPPSSRDFTCHPLARGLQIHHVWLWHRCSCSGGKHFNHWVLSLWSNCLKVSFVCMIGQYLSPYHPRMRVAAQLRLHIWISSQHSFIYPWMARPVR